jgi:trans-aconitate 2-methyltransferase
MSAERSRDWDAKAYHQVSGPQVEMGRRVLERLPLRGDETVLDAGCGTGRVTALLLEQLPRGRVIAVDADPAMVEAARVSLGDGGGRLDVRQADLLALDLAPSEAVDAILSTATFHWILDHDRLFANLYRALRPGGRLVAQCGGAGNIAANLAAADAEAANPRWASRFEGWTRPSQMATAEETETRLLAAGFDGVHCWLEPAPVTPDDPHLYLKTITLGSHVQRLDESDRADFVANVVGRMSASGPVTIDYVRLNIDAHRR